MSALISIVIPVFNRAWCLERAIFSALAFLRQFGSGQIVVIDDGSSDGSFELAEGLLSSIEDDFIAWDIRKQVNKGVCAAKNAGARIAKGEWIVFLDSDDELLESSAASVKLSLFQHSGTPLQFYRCIDESGQFIGSDLAESHLIDLDDFILRGTRGESLPVVFRETFLKYMYDEDISGFEGLCYARIIHNEQSALLSNICARKYYTSHDQRLSSKSGIRNRSKSISIGFLRLYQEHSGMISLSAKVRILTRYIYHRVRSLIL